MEPYKLSSFHYPFFRWEHAVSVFIFSALLLAGIKTTAKSAENWTNVSGEIYSVAQLSALPYKNFFVAAARYPSGFSFLTNFMTSTDSYHWTIRQTNATGLTFSNFVVLDDTIYLLLGYDLLKSTDGNSWIKTDDGSIPVSNEYPLLRYSQMAAFNGSLYTLDNLGTIGRFTSTPSGMHWTFVFATSSASAPTGTGNKLFTFKGFLYAAGDQLWRSPDGNLNSWEEPLSTSSVGGSTFVQFNDQLYLYSGGFQIVSDAGTPFTYTQLPDNFPRIAFSVNGILHGINSDYTRLLALINGSWQDAAPAFFNRFTFTNPTDQDVFVIGDRVHSILSGTELKLGLTSIENGLAQTLPGVLVAGQKSALLLKWTARLSLSETFSGITVKNLGTAAGDRDLVNLKLSRAPAGSDGSSLAPVASLSLSGDQKTWTTPSNFNLTLYDDTDFYVTADVATRPVEGGTCIFNLPTDGMPRTVNQSPINGLPLTAGNVQTISAGTSGHLEGVEPYPQPASDKVKFPYTLDLDSDVLIQLYDEGGRLVSEVREDGKAAAARAITVWDCSAKAPGMYLALIKITPLSGGGEKKFKRKVVVKR